MKLLEEFKLDITRMFFSLEGRLNRKPYFFGNLAIGIISSIITFITSHSSGILISILGFIVGVAIIIGGVSLVVKRLHDLDKGGLFALLMLIPIVDFFFGLYLLVAKGTEGVNRFGEDPLQI